MNHSVEIKIDPIDLCDVCPYCFGTGRIKAMQSYATYNGMSIRGQDTTVKCTACNGTGRRIPDEVRELHQIR